MDRKIEQIKKVMQIIAEFSHYKYLPDDIGSLSKRIVDALYSSQEPQPETPDELLTDEEIRNNFRSNGEESYLRYCAELGIDLQDGINIARFGANKQLLKCHQSEAAIRADQNKKIGNYLDGQCDKGVRQGRWECNDCMWRIRENLMKGNAPEGEK